MIGIIGGSGLEGPKLFSGFEEKKISTPFGDPSSAIAFGKIGKTAVAVLSRHGKNHSINPSNVNYRANIWGFKELGVTHILAASACGSLREKISPGYLVVPDQFIDWTTKRETSFFDKEKVAHIPMAKPFCGVLSKIFFETGRKLGFKIHGKGTVVTIEGPRFSTKAESLMFRSFGADIINMTTVPECVLAREAGICYSVIAMATDYDSWRSHDESVTIGIVLKLMKENAGKVKNIFADALPKIPKKRLGCSCETDIKSAII